MKNLSKMLIAYRQKYDINSSELAAEIGLHPSTMTRLEQGRALDSEGMVKIISWIFAPADAKAEKKEPTQNSLGVE